MSMFTATLTQIVNKPPTVRVLVDMEPFKGMTHVTAHDVARIMETSTENARYYIRKMCKAGTLVEDGQTAMETPRSIIKIKRFKIIRG